MANVYDVAKYILIKTGQITSMKLQKLMYYSQAWSLVWDEEALFDEDFEAWANGPVLRCLFVKHKGLFKVDSSLLIDYDENLLNEEQKETIDLVLKNYGSFTGQQLSRQTHSEAPWKEAREGIEPMEQSTRVIDKSSIAWYYSSL